MDRRCRTDDRGSVVPLVIGLMLGLLLLSVGVTAATSAFLARSNLQSTCDGAAAAAAEEVKGDILRSGTTSDLAPVAIGAATGYAAGRGVSAQINAGVTEAATTLDCTGSFPITFGGLFGKPEMTFTVTAVGFPVL